jgi:signal peptidase II
MSGMSENKLSVKPAVLVFLLSAGLVVVADLWTKDAIFKLLKVETVGSPPQVSRQEEKTIIPGCFNLQANYNTGAFRGLFSEHTDWLVVLSLGALAIILAIFAAQFRGGKAPAIVFSLALAFLWGGTLGNLYDRWLLGGVRDWVKWYVVIGGRERVWPNFNVADSAICVGVGLLILHELLAAWRQRKSSGS